MPRVVLFKRRPVPPKMRACLSCGQPVVSDAAVCRHCGSRAPVARWGKLLFMLAVAALIVVVLVLSR